MKYAHLFETRQEFETAYSYGEGGSYEEPWLSLTTTTDGVAYNKKPDRQYLTFEALEDGTFSYTEDMEYSVDGCKTWVPLSANTATPTVEAGSKISFRGEVTYVPPEPEPKSGGTKAGETKDGSNNPSFCGTFSSTKTFNAMGNPLSMLNGDNFETEGQNCRLMNLFYECTNLISAENLKLTETTLVDNCYSDMFLGCTALTTAPELPATTLAQYCYSSMFSGCTSLTTAPELPATTLARDCYHSMFYGCTRLTEAPELPATTLANNCYENMFMGCEALTKAPELPATTVTNECYSGMFNGCTALSAAPELPSTTLAQGCYRDMFWGCTSLTTAPELPATTVKWYCYGGMFSGCTSLTTAPDLPATTLAQSCYESMFRGCTSLTTAPSVLPATTLGAYNFDCYRYMFYGCTALTTAPELPATILLDRCYEYMFNGCTNLNYIKAMFTTTPSDTYTKGWVDGVASTGTFVKNSAAQWNVTGTYGVPTGWTVQTATAE